MAEARPRLLGFAQCHHCVCIYVQSDIAGISAAHLYMWYEGRQFASRNLPSLSQAIIMIIV